MDAQANAADISQLDERAPNLDFLEGDAGIAAAYRFFNLHSKGYSEDDKTYPQGCSNFACNHDDLVCRSAAGVIGSGGGSSHGGV